jgi:hypothetical protein
MQHLSRDAEFAEDLAIRHADACCGLHGRDFEDMTEYTRARTVCMARLFKVIANAHSISQDDVWRSLGQRSAVQDVAVMLSFAFLYALAASVLAGWLGRIYRPRDAFITAAIMTIIVSFPASLLATMLGEVWSLAWESARLRTGHLSYRVSRVPWTQHRLALYVSSQILFLSIAAFQGFRATKQYAQDNQEGSSQTGSILGL